MAPAADMDSEAQFQRWNGNGNKQRNGAVSGVFHIIAASGLSGVVALAAFFYSWHEDAKKADELLLTRIIILEQSQHIQDAALSNAVQLGHQQREDLQRQVTQHGIEIEQLRQTTCGLSFTACSRK